jgi:HK97 family phage prohead protease
MSAVLGNGFERRYASGSTQVDLSIDKKIRGTAIVFNSRSVDLGGFTEIIKSEAVDRTIREGLDVRALVDHDTGKVIGRTRAGTLALRKSRRGLEIEIDPPDTTVARDILANLEAGNVSGMSFGFRVLTDEWRMEDGAPVREVLDMIISEVSIVAFPAYEETSADVQEAKRALTAFVQAQVPMRDDRDHRLRMLL